MNNNMIDERKIPDFVLAITQTFDTNGYEAFIVGGSTRDLLRGVTPKDWDLATNATPDQILELFPDSYYENSFGTVGIKFSRETSENVHTDIVEVTTYRYESEYSDSRRPDSVQFVTDIRRDLSRRDFTINAIAYNPVTREIVDPYDGLEDIHNKVISCVGDPQKRFAEDALRMLRAIRFQTQLGFIVSYETINALITCSSLLKNVSRERVFDELCKILMSDNPAEGIALLDKAHLLEHVLPELLVAKGVEQGGAHSYDVYEHLVLSLQHTADQGWGLELRLAALLHDIAKPATRGTGKHKKYSFYGHEVVGAKMAKKILDRFKCSNKLKDKIILLIRHHMFLSDPDEITLSAVRRLIARVGKENVEDLIKLRMADRIGTGRPVAEPYRLRKFQAMIDEVTTDPISVKMLAINGDQLISELDIRPGPRIGHVLQALLQSVLDDPSLNRYETLLDMSKALLKLSDTELRQKGHDAEKHNIAMHEKKVAHIYNKRKTQK
jgi:poly(A) polymerase/tRNA nucleotidyltransferase (CCA-adding enzyme)